METTVYNEKGSESSSVDLPDSVFAEPMRPDLLHRAVTAAQHNSRHPVAHTKERSDRRGGGKKPWRQKGTGRARHGSTRSPLWRKGGVTFGPRSDRNLKKSVNQKEKQAALSVALSGKLRDDEMLLIEGWNFDEPSAAKARDILDSLGEIDGYQELAERNKNAALFVVPDTTENLTLSFRNFGNIGIQTADDLHALDLLTYKYTVVVEPESVVEKLTDRLTEDN
jgi:large subunit ribosomal protein L4